MKKAWDKWYPTEENSQLDSFQAGYQAALQQAQRREQNLVYALQEILEDTDSADFLAREALAEYRKLKEMV